MFDPEACLAELDRLELPDGRRERGAARQRRRAARPVAESPDRAQAIGAAVERVELAERGQRAVTASAPLARRHSATSSSKIAADARRQSTPCDVSRTSRRRVPRIGLALHVSESHQFVEHLTRGLLGDPEPAAEFARRRFRPADRLERVAVCRPQVRVPALGEAPVELLDRGPAGP